MRPLYIAFVVALLSVVGSRAHAQDERFLGGPPPSDGPVEVRIGFNLFNITDVDEKEETIDLDGSIQLMWMDPRQAYDPSELGLPDNDFVSGDYSNAPGRLYQGDYEVKEVFQGWRPHIKLTSGIGDRQKTHTAMGVWPDGMVWYTDHFHATVETPMDLRRFPFDRQELEVYLHLFVFGRNEVILVHDDRLAGSWTQDSGIADWTKLGMDIEARPMQYTLKDGQKRLFSEVLVTITIARRPGHILFSIILPLLILVSLTWCVFWMDEESISNRVNISLVGILSVVAYYFVVLDSVPKLPYLTMMDAFMIATFLVLAASVVVSIVVDKLNRHGREGTGDKLDYTCRWAFPVGYVALTVLIVAGFSVFG